MKAIISFLVIFSIGIKSSWAQYPYKFEEFSVNGQKGIVNTQTLEEVLMPIYNKHILNFTENLFILKKNEDTIVVFNKHSGKWSAPMRLANEYRKISLNKKNYLYTVDKGKYILLDSLLQKKYLLPKLLNPLYHHYDFPENFFIAKDKDTLEVYRIEKSSLKLLHRIKATDFYITKVKDKGTEMKLYVLNGFEKQYIFDEYFKLKDISLDYYNDANLSDLSSGGKRAPNVQLKRTIGDGMSEYDVYSSSNSSPFKMHLASNYRLYTQYNSTCYFVEGGTSDSAKNVYSFKIDTANAKALLPLKYQEEMRLKIIKK